MSTQHQRVLSVAEYTILGVLREQPAHGYEVARRFARESDLGLVLPLEMSHVYAILKELQDSGYLIGHREAAGARPPRTVFTVAPAAERAFCAWLTAPVSRLREVRLDFLLKLYFCRRAGAEPTADLLAAQVQSCRAYVQEMTRLAAACPPHSFERLVREAKISPAQATLAWLQALQAEVAL